MSNSNYVIIVGDEFFNERIYQYAHDIDSLKVKIISFIKEEQNKNFNQQFLDISNSAVEELLRGEIPLLSNKKEVLDKALFYGLDKYIYAKQIY